jgi:hypothetical protein
MRSVWHRLAAPIAIAAACHAATLAALPPTAFAQQAKGDKTSVGSLIQRGSELFDDASYEESIQTLSAALLRPGTSKAEKVEIYRLLAYNYITLKRTEEADAAVRGLLVLDEKFTLPPSESPRFRDFFKVTREKWEAEGKPGLSDAQSPAAEKPIKIMHSSPAQVAPGTTIKLTGHIEDPDGKVRGVQLAFRTGAEGKFVLASATYTLGDFRAQIPGDAVKPPLIEYYLQAVDKGGLPLTSRGDAATPLRIAVPEKKGGVLSSPWFWVPVGLAVVGGGVATAFILANRNSNQTSTVTVNVRE